MKKLLSALIAVSVASAIHAQSTADYTNALNRFKTYYNADQTDSIFYMFSDKIKTLLPADKTDATFSGLKKQMGVLRWYEPQNEKDGLRYYKIVFEKSILTLVTSLDKDNKLGKFRFMPYTDSLGRAVNNVTLKTATGNVYGTLEVPDGIDRPAVVLIVAGSGPTDRNGNSVLGVSSNTYKMIADSLKGWGIASLRYDKRGVGESNGALKSPDALRFEDMVADAAGFVKQLKDSKKYSKVIVLGHSEGSLVGMMAAEQARADAYISVAGIAERADKVIEAQVAKQSDDLAVRAKVLLDSLVKGYTVSNVDMPLQTVFNPSVQPYLISWLKYEPQKEIKKLNMPAMIIQGTTDVQVSTDQAELLKKACPRAELKYIPGMNHVLKASVPNREENLATYTKPDLPLADGLMPAIITFVKGIK